MARILVVDDEPDIVVIVGHMLRKAGHDVMGAHSGEEALVKMNFFKPDLILLDIMMPGIDGWETLKLIRGMDGFKHVAVSMLTAKNLTPGVASSEDVHGLIDYIQKPINKGVLLGKVDSILMELGRIARMKERMNKAAASEDAISAYEIFATAERFHNNILGTLKQVLGRSGGDGDLSKRQDAISSQEKAIEFFRKKREEIENTFQIEDTNI